MAELIVIAGTRPEVIKLAPIIKALQRSSLKSEFVLSGQHPDLSDDVLQSLDLEYNEKLVGVGRQNTLDLLESKLFESIGYYFRKSSARNVIALGDTSTVFVASRLAFLTGKRFFHVEAGLRTKDRFSPFPEEQNRRTISQYTSVHFAPSKQAKKNLVEEKYDPSSIHVVGSPFIEAFNDVRELGKSIDFFLKNNKHGQWDFLLYGEKHKGSGIPIKKILITSHRRENIPDGIEAVCDLALQLSQREEMPHYVIWPVHPNPRVDDIVRQKLRNKPRVKLIRSLVYHEMSWLMEQVDCIVTDSAGVMEEASFIGVPTVVSRTDTERPDLIQASDNLILAKPELPELIRAIDTALEMKKLSVDQSRHLYGGAPASKRIVDILEQEL